MSFEVWVAFAAAAALILVTPGPTIMLVVSQAMSHGKRSVFPLVAGVTSGDFTAMTLSILGLGAILSASAALFSALKFFGSLYLVYLGIKLFRSKSYVENMQLTGSEKSGLSLFRSAYIVTALNPKSIVFFVAFLPQFVDPAYSAGPQFIILGATFLTLGTINATLYGFFAGFFREKTSKRETVRRLERCGGVVLIGAGVFTAAFAKPS